MTAAANASVSAEPAVEIGYPALPPYDAEAFPPALAKNEHLASARLWADAIALMIADAPSAGALMQALAFGLETPNLLRWACLAARLEEVVSARKKRSEALVAAERWLREGGEPLRYEAYRLAHAEEYDSPGAMAAVAAFTSGPSLAPIDQPPSPPGSGLARSSATGVLVTVAACDALGAHGFERVNLIGLDLARGGDGRSGARDALSRSAS
ncbi:hypothetical protein BH11PSE2_BH11PSE2_19230 [soil metagenome]